MFLRAVSLTLLLLATAFAFQPMPAAAATCPPDNGHVWFLGVVYDAAIREDFELDVDNFEFYLTKLRESYCIPDSQAKILAFFNNYERNGKTYEAATEAATKSYLASFGAAASAHSDSIFFFFLSSHGNVYATASCVGGLRTPGSFSALRSTFGAGAQDGIFRDCELGNELNTKFAPTTRMFIAVDCSFCGGFSDSLTAASGTIPDDQTPKSSGVPGANRIVVTGCAITTECFGSDGGGVSYKHLKRGITLGMVFCDGFTVPGFPQVQGVDAPVKHAMFNPVDGRCTASEWFFSAVWSAYSSIDVIGIQEQFRIKYGFPSLADDLLIY